MSLNYPLAKGTTSPNPTGEFPCTVICDLLFPFPHGCPAGTGTLALLSMQR